MKRWKVLVTAPRALTVIDRYRRDLGRAGCDVAAASSDERFEEAQLLSLVVDVDGIICGDDRITRRVLDAAPRLRVISKWGTGIDSIDVDYAKQRGVTVCNTPGAFSDAVAETVLGYMLLFARKLDTMAADMRAGHWRRLPLTTLGEATLGIVGLGDSGRAVARRARAFGMRILSSTTNDVQPAVLDELGVELVGLDRLLAESDYVTLHANLDAGSRHLLGAIQLRSMRRSAVLINTARGELVDEAALVAALREGWIAGAALDVFAHEPLPLTSDLRGLPNVYLAPHNANASSLAAERVHGNSIKNLLEALGATTEP